MNEFESDPRERRIAFRALAVLALPVLAAIWSLPWFVTQDGPADLYSGHLLARCLAGDAWLASFAGIQHAPLPNLLAPLSLAALTSVLPGRVPDQILMSVTFAGFGFSVVVLRGAVRGTSGLLLIVPSLCSFLSAAFGCSASTAFFSGRLCSL